MALLKGVIKEIAMIFIAAWLVLGSLAVPNKVADRVELAQVRLGYPVCFVVQDSSGLAIGLPDSPPFPYPLGFGSPWDNPARFLWGNFWLSLILVCAAVRLALYALNRYS